MSKQQMGLADTAWLHMDRSDNLMVVTSLFWFEDPVDWDEVGRIFQERIADRYPRFRQRVTDHAVGMPVWEDDPDFDLGRHLTRLTLPPPGDEAALQELVSDVASRDLPHDRPLWQAWLVDGYGTGAAVVVRIHHCLADGIALARVLLEMTDDATGQPTIASAPSRPGAVRAALLRRTQRALRHPVRSATSTIRTAVDGTYSLSKLLFAPPDHRSSLKGDIGPGKRVAWLAPIGLDDIKGIGRANDATVNDVMVAAIGGALRRYVSGRGDHPSDLRAFVPVNLRRLDRPVPRDLGNRFGLALLSLPVGQEGMERRLDVAKRRMTRIKRSPEGPISYGILNVIGRLPRPLEAPVVEMFGMKVSLVVTNVPGPREPLHLAGTRIAGVVAWEPESAKLALGLAILSVNGEVFLGAIADRHRIPDPEAILLGIHAELELLGLPAPPAAARVEAREPTEADIAAQELAGV
jgi:diacylglycerol O-acyltransferase / wax synthase